MGLVEGKVAFVTGAASGIGRASAIKFAQEGAKVIVADVSVKDGEETVKMIKDAGGEAAFIRCDVAKASDVQAAVQFAVTTFGKLNCALNNAGIPSGNALISDTTEADWDRVININLKGVWLCMKFEIPAMLAAGGGAIVNTSSTGGLVAVPKHTPYSGAKWGVNGITKVVAVEYAKAVIRVNSVCPGLILTPMIEPAFQGDAATKKQVEALMTSATPMGRLGKPEEVAEAVVWLCSDKASYITGQNIAVDGGMTAI